MGSIALPHRFDVPCSSLLISLRAAALRPLPSLSLSLSHPLTPSVDRSFACWLTWTSRRVDETPITIAERGRDGGLLNPRINSRAQSMYTYICQRISVACNRCTSMTLTARHRERERESVVCVSISHSLSLLFLILESTAGLLGAI